MLLPLSPYSPSAFPRLGFSADPTPITVGIIAFFAFGSWFVWARRSVTGPVRHVEEVVVDGRVERKVELTTGQEVVEGDGKRKGSAEGAVVGTKDVKKTT